MNSYKTYLILLCLFISSFTPQALSEEQGEEQSEEQNYRIRLYFGLSLPEGGGVSLLQWESFQRDTLATTFEGFNVVDSTGYYKGKPERSKIVTLITNQQGIAKVKRVAGLYAKTYQQESVMMVKIKVDEWAFIQAVK